MGEPDTIRAAFVIFVCKDKALFLQRSNQGDHPGEWCFPGGKIEAGESAEEAAKRECREEIGRMPKGPLVLHARKISTGISVSADAVEAGAAPSSPGVDATTFVCKVADEFEPTLNDEHTGWAWAPISNPPQPCHPGAASSLAKFTMNEYDIAVAMMHGELVSPQKFMNLWLFDMRITGTGMSFRGKHNEFVVRDPSLYLNDYFLARCAGLQVIVEHPKDDTLTDEEFRDRTIGAIMLPYIKGDEVWGIAKIHDSAAGQMMAENQLSTSPSVVFRETDGNTQIEVDGAKILIEGRPSLLDHLAVCRVGVWDKGGPPSGIVTTRGDSAMADEKDDKKADNSHEDKKADATKADAGGDLMSMMDAFRADMKAFGDSMKAMGDSLRSDMKDCYAKMDSFRADAAKADSKKADADDEDKKADADDEDKKSDSKKADSKKADGEDDMDDKKSDAARADAIEAAIENSPLVKGLREQIESLRGRTAAVHSGEDREKFAQAQLRADDAFNAHGERAPAPLLSEQLTDYRRRLVMSHQKHSAMWKDTDLTKIADEATFDVIEKQIYADSIKAASSPVGVPFGELRRITKRDATGMREVTEYSGDPRSWMRQFGGQPRQVRQLRTPGSLQVH